MEEVVFVADVMLLFECLLCVSSLLILKVGGLFLRVGVC